MKRQTWRMLIAVLLLALCVAFLNLQTVPGSAASESVALTYPVVDTGQTTCYNNERVVVCPDEGDAFYGQDAQVAGNAPSYTDNGNGTVTDNVTGMMWQKSPDVEEDGDIDTNDKMTYDEACAYCENLTLVGYDDWQLPTIKQLYSLIDFRGTDPMADNTAGLIPFVDTDYFDFGYGDMDAGERVIDAQYASSTLYVADSNQMFGVNFADGRIKGYGLSRPGPGNDDMEFYVRCVRQTGSYGVNDFNNKGDGTIIDGATGLMWAQDDSGMGMNWEDALAYIEQKNAENYLGYSDWRLPDAKELQSLVDYARSPDTTDSAAIDPLFNVTSITNEAGETDYPYYWSSTTHARVDGSGTSAVYVAFGRSLGTMDEVNVIDVHGAGAQRSDPKDGDPVDYPAFHGPQGDVQRVFNYVRLVRDAEVEETPTPTETPTEGPTDGPTETPTETPLPSPEGEEKLYLPLILNTDAGDASDTGGYTLFAPLNETTTYLIDEEGETVFTWESDYRPGNAVYLLENGNLLHTGNTQSDSGIS